VLACLPRPSAAVALVVGALLLAASPSVPAAAASSSVAAVSQPLAHPARAGAGYLARQLADAESSGDGILTSGGYGQVGETIDAELSLAAAKVAAGQQASTLAALKPQVGSYVSYRGTYYAGSLAKMMIVVQAEGQNPNTFGSVPLLRKLRAMRCTAVAKPAGCTKADIGLYKSYDPHGTGNAYNSTIYQSLALIALSRTPKSPAGSAVSWLAGQQCTDGGFQTAIRSASAACTSEDVDTTSYAAQALAATGATAAAHRAAAYVAGAQRSNGSLASASGRASANSTALAAQAFLAVGGSYRADASSARSYLVSEQSGCSAAPAKRGAVAAPADGDATFASSQAVQALAGTPLADIRGSGSRSYVPRVGCGS